MKKLISLAACIMAVVMVAVSCTPKDKPDGRCELTSFDLSSTIAGTIDAAAKTITVVIPTSVTSNSFTPTFKVTDYDVVTIGGTPVTSGETAVILADGTKVIVADEVSAMTTEYIIKVISNDQKAELLGVSFKAADNSLLSEDVTPDAIASEMVVRVPGEAFRQELTVTVEAGFNDVIKVNNETVTSGSSIKVDTNFPIDITVTDSVDGATAKYVLKVGKILNYVVSKLGVYAEGTMNDLSMTLNPNDNLPYFAYTRKLEGESNWGVSLAKWNGSAFEMVGPTGIADASGRSASKPQVAFAKDGTTYVKYLAGEVASKPTVKKLDAAWTLIGEAGCGLTHNANTSYAYPFYVDPTSSKPVIFWCGNTKNQADYRTMNYASANGESWSTVIVTGSIPAYGSGATTTSGMYYTSCAVENDGKIYIVSSFNQFGYYVHEVNADGTLKTIVDNFIPDNAPYGIGSNLQMKLGPNGTLYVLAVVNAGDNSMQVYTVDQNAGTLKPYGAGSSAISILSTGAEEDYGMAVNPIDGLVVSVYDTEKGKGAPVFAYLDDNLQWNTFEVDNPALSTSAFYMQFDKTGENCYVAYMAADGINLYRIGLEADILPE